MKKLALSLIAALVAFAGTAQANNEVLSDMLRTELQLSIAGEMHTNNLINWKVGEYQEYDMTAIFGSLGKMTKKVASEEGNAIWVKAEVTGMMSQKVDTLIDRATGKVLKYVENGQEKQMPDDKIEVISQDATTITVPAGTFEVIHIVAKSEKIKKLELWANPRDITMDGGAQMVIDAGMITVTMKLTKFGGR
jgi:hypothetical protein